MGTIKTEVKQFFGGAISTIGDAKDKFFDSIRGTVNEVSASVGGLVSGDVVGINVNKIPDMQNAIQEAVKSIETHLNTVHTETDPAKAFADVGMQDACREYISGTMEACKAYTSNLLRFYDLLSEVKQYYVDNQTAQSETVKGAATDMASSVEKYTQVDAA